MRSFILAATLAVPTVAMANDDKLAFVEANAIGIFYHELGHALIDIGQVPIFGQEEDAADVASIMLIDQFFDEESAQAVAYDAAWGFFGEHIMAEDEEVTYWGVHGPSLQRFYNTVCLFYGGDPDGRADFAEYFELPEERAEYCPEEYDQALNAWGGVFDELAGEGESVGFVAADDGIPGGEVLNTVIEAEVAYLNEVFNLPLDLLVVVESCGEANAFYDPAAVEIVMCTEFVTHLEEMFGRL